MKQISHEEINRQYDYMRRVRGIIGEGKKACVQTFGCQQNEADSERLGGMLSEMGFEIVYDVKDADLILVNTCAVREHAELKALSITGQFKHLKDAKPSLLIGICGCMVTQEHRAGTIK
ncbi:MAG: tRNA (N6-isopentenyl adenosine(37)-C2)-methylthiotransferase MiaB, partial [Clostridia bacterium]|nr:tRNA (N6-isopentenyl adenosine(37)-C2)-methylthiotransferase MiaB [Clostridia bacterium]